MWKPSQNPKIEELTKSYRNRTFLLSDLDIVKLDGITKNCIWCLQKLAGRQYKWCSEQCSNYALAWARPQCEHGLHVLLARQDFLCAHCKFSYIPYINKSLQYLNHNHATIDPSTIKTQISWLLMKILKNNVPKIHRPEVDHIVPISKGGTAIGLENHQIICYY